MVYRLDPENVRPPRGGPSGALALAVVLALVVGVWAFAGGDPGSPMGSGVEESAAPTDAPPAQDPASGLPLISAAQLPQPALDLLVEIESGEAPPGAPFANTAGQLPTQEPGYYTAYAVAPTAAEGASAWRLVVGRGQETYWTEDAAVTFARVGP